MLTVFLFWTACFFGGLFALGAIADNIGPQDAEPDPDSAEVMLYRLTKGE